MCEGKVKVIVELLGLWKNFCIFDDEWDMEFWWCLCGFVNKFYLLIKVVVFLVLLYSYLFIS